MSALSLLEVEKLGSSILGAIDKMHTSGGDRGALRAQVVDDLSRISEAVLQLESTRITAQSEVIKAEAQGHSWLQRNWRPLVMVMFAGIVAWNYVAVDILSWLHNAVAPEIPTPPRLEIPTGMWALLTAGLSGYVVGRSGEKIAMTLSKSQEPVLAGLFDKRKKQRRRRPREEPE